MSLKVQNKETLLKIAAYYDVEIAEGLTNPEIVTALEENGVTWADYKRVQKLDPLAPSEEGEVAEVITTESMKVEVEANEPVPEAPEPEVVTEPAPTQKKHLVRMTRSNHSFQRRGYKFTKAHPFALVEESDVNHFLEELTGFRLASPQEAKNYYN